MGATRARSAPPSGPSALPVGRPTPWVGGRRGALGGRGIGLVWTGGCALCARWVGLCVRCAREVDGDWLDFAVILLVA